MKKKKAKATNNSPYRVWDRVKVSRDLFGLLIEHPVFRMEPKAINTAQYWLNAIDAAMERNDDNPVTWGWKDIQDRFRRFKQSHKVFRDALRKLGLITFTRFKPPPNFGIKGECRRFEITPLGRQLVAGGNFAWLHNLLNDPQTRRRNQVAISKRKRDRLVHEEPMSKVIDEFRHIVKFERDGLLNQLRYDEANCPGRFKSVLHHLLAFERKTFVELELKEGRIYYEFVALPSEYRRFALFNGKPYVATLDIRACHPTFLGRMLWEFQQNEAAAIAAKFNGRAVNGRALEVESKQWTDIFTHPTNDPRDVILGDAEIRLDRTDMKQCLNTWLNGAKKYRRKTDGRWDMRNNKRLEAWFQGRFPEMAKVWAAMEQRQITGRLIMEEYEFPLMLNPALYAVGDGLGLTLCYEYDGVGVFAERDDPELPAKLENIKVFIQRQSVEQFQVPVVVKAEVLTH